MEEMAFWGLNLILRRALVYFVFPLALVLINTLAVKASAPLNTLSTWVCTIPLTPGKVVRPHRGILRHHQVGMLLGSLSPNGLRQPNA